MKTLRLAMLLAIHAIGFSFLTGCQSQSDSIEMIEKEQVKNARDLYVSLMEIPTSSLLSESSVNSRATSNTYPVLTEDDVFYLSSLSLNELEYLMSKFQSKLDSDDYLYIESRRDETLLKNFEILGGHEGFDRIMEFYDSYMGVEPGWTSLEKLLPNNLEEQQIDLYVNYAVYIDRIARPVSRVLTLIAEPSSRGFADEQCKMAANAKLREAGLDLEIDALTEIISGGCTTIFTTIDALELGGEVAVIIYEYHKCLELNN
ncbi:MAG: hypothetical protein HDR49_05445 [Bacteroides sp.]|nr:hypothetical protein [Bacteroides sp.]